MGLSEIPHPTILSRKRCRNEEAFLTEVPLPPRKQACLETLPAPHSQSQQFSYLEELESSLDTCTLESPTPEDLVAEMMQSLERALGDSEEQSETPYDETLMSEVETLVTLPETHIRVLPEIITSDSEALVAEFALEASDLESSGRISPDLEPSWVSPLAKLLNASSVSHCDGSDERSSEEGDCSHAGVDLRHLLELSDDELGIPASSNPDNEVSAHLSDDDWSLLDESCSDSAPGFYSSSQDGGVYAQLMGGWLDNDCGFGHCEESMLDFVRDHGGMIVLDGYL